MELFVITDVVVVHEPGYAEGIGTKLAEIDGVKRVYYTTGDVDFVVVSRTQNRDRLDELIDNIVQIEGVNETSSTFIVDEIKTDGNVVTSMSDDLVDNATSSETN